MTPFEQRRAAQDAAAAQRYEDRIAQRLSQMDAIRAGDLVAANPPERIAARIDRLSRWCVDDPLAHRPDELPTAAPAQVAADALARAGRAELPSDVAVAVVEAEPAEPLATAGVVLERIINTADFLGVRYLELGIAAARAVGRIEIRDGAGDVEGHGTGSMVSARLLLTNHHVLPDSGTAAGSVVEFDFQDGRDGRQLPTKTFALDPESFFLADEDLDFALVAVGPGPEPLAGFGFNRLIEARGKAVIGEHVTIVQHPRGGKKQIALRENKIVDLAEPMLHYEADTEPGSSGSPVFNDQWEIIALHHASVPAPDRPELGGFQNEGILVRKIVEFVRDQPLTAQERRLFDELLEPESLARPRPPLSSAPTGGNGARPQLSAGDGHAPPAGGLAAATDLAPGASQPGASVAPPPTSRGGELVLPLELTVRIGPAGGQGGVLAARAAPDGAPASTAAAVPEALAIDPDYASRRGYDPGFLGEAARVPLPALPDALRAEAAVRDAPGDPEPHVLRYHHFSVVQSRVRRLAFLTAVNIDGAQSARIRRGRDRWVLDPRIPVAEQTGEAVYADNPLDRGHLVRRLDPAWGATASERQFANDDTFHFTNCTPQHEDFNQNQQTWAGLEDYVLENADNRDLRVSVFTGPVFASDDDVFEGVRLPRQFWKVVAMVKAGGQLSATAYLLSQERLLVGLESDEPFSYGAYETFQVRIAEIARLTGLDFGALEAADPLAALETTARIRRVKTLDEVIL